MPGPSAGSTLGAVTSLGAMQGDVAAALEAVSIPSYAIDSDGVVRWVNPAAQALVGDARGRQFTSFVAPPDQRRARELFAQKIAGTAKVTDAEAVLLDKHENALVVELSSVPLVQGGRIVGVFGQAHVEGPAAEVPHLLPLTPRQTEVLRLLERGRSTGEIADQLNLSRRPSATTFATSSARSACTRGWKPSWLPGGRTAGRRSPPTVLTPRSRTPPPAERAFGGLRPAAAPGPARPGPSAAATGGPEPRPAVRVAIAGLEPGVKPAAGRLRG
jgi:PAS domain S-box-containing protein